MISKLTTVRCDRCGKERDQGFVAWLRLVAGYPWDTSRLYPHREFDFCEDCTKAFEAFVKP